MLRTTINLKVYRQCGVDTIVTKEVEVTVLNFDPGSDRLVPFRLQGSYKTKPSEQILLLGRNSTKWKMHRKTVKTNNLSAALDLLQFEIIEKLDVEHVKEWSEEQEL